MMAKLPVNYEIRFASLLDIPALIRADRAASELFRPTGLIPDMAAIPQSIPADTLAAAIEQGMVLTVTDVQGDISHPVGFSMTQRREKTLYLHQLSVDPAHGRKGLGAGLVKHVFALAEEYACHSVTLSTFRDVAWNGPFYAKLGFREIPRKKLEHWMLEIERDQAATLDVSLRCFMRRSVRRSLLGRQSKIKQMTNPSKNGRLFS